MRPGQARRGFAISIPLVITLMVALAIFGFAALFRSGSSLGIAAQDAGGAVAESVAFSAIEEALWHFQRAANDPDSPLFETLRTALIAGDEPTFDVTEVIPERQLNDLLRRHLEDSPHRRLFDHVTLEGLSMVVRVPLRPAAVAELGPDRADEVVLPGEQFVDVSAAASLDLRGQRIWRQVAVRRRYGVTFVSPYKPFDALTFAILSSGFLETYPEVVQGMQRALDEISQAQAFLRSIQDQLTLVALGLQGRVVARPGLVTLGEAPDMTPDARAAARWAEQEMDSAQRGAFDALEGAAQAWARWQLAALEGATLLDRPGPEAPVDVSLDLPVFQPEEVDDDLPSMDSILFSLASTVRLEDFDHGRRIAEDFHPLLEELTEAAEQYNEAVVPMLGISESPLTAGELRNLARSSQDFGSVIRRLVPEMIDLLNDVTAKARAQTLPGFTTQTFLDAQAGGSRRLRNLAYHADSSGALSFLQSMIGAFNGHIAIYGEHPLVLDHPDWRGRTLISVPWDPGAVPTEVRGIRVDDPDRDLLVLSLVDTRFTSATNQAAVYVHGAATFSGSPRIQGQLLLRRLPPRAQRAPDQDLQGLVEYDPRIDSGERWRRPEGTRVGQAVSPGRSLSYEHYTIGICPRYQRRAIFRKPQALDEGWLDLEDA